MQINDLESKLRKYIRERYEVPEADEGFTDDVHLFDYGYVDSFGAVDLIRFVEQEFGVTIGPSDLVAYPLNTINEISGFVTSRIRGGSHANTGR